MSLTFAIGIDNVRSSIIFIPFHSVAGCHEYLLDLWYSRGLCFQYATFLWNNDFDRKFSCQYLKQSKPVLMLPAMVPFVIASLACICSMIIFPICLAFSQHALLRSYEICTRTSYSTSCTSEHYIDTDDALTILGFWAIGCMFSCMHNVYVYIKFLSYIPTIKINELVLIFIYKHFQGLSCIWPFVYTQCTSSWKKNSIEIICICQPAIETKTLARRLRPKADISDHLDTF